jgi:hypothetical protein
MKLLLLGLLVFASSISLRADILANSGFADGRAHWKGDAKDVNTDNLGAGSQVGVTITLKKDKWTKIYQMFTTHEKKVQYSISFTLSSDYHVEHDSSEGSSSIMGPSAGLQDIDGMYPLYLSTYSTSWVLIVQQFGSGGSSFIYLRPDTKNADSQTLTGKIRGFTDSTDEKILVLAFPPGEGSITLTNVSLSPETADN